MVCVASFRNFVFPATNLINLSSVKNGHFRGWGRNLDVKPGLTCNWSSRRFRASVKMMVDSSASMGPPAIVNALPEKGQGGDGAFVGGWKSEDGRLSYGYSSFRGRRASMEDFYDVKISNINEQTVSLFGIFDGHGGSHAAEYLKEHLFKNLMKHPQFMTHKIGRETYKKLDSDFLEDENNACRDDGSTASTAILIGNQLCVANVGDSRVVMLKAGEAIPLSDDHKPNRSDERRRIENAGGFVIWAGTWRVGGLLAMSCAFGNRLLKQYVVAEPEIQKEEVDEELELLVLASDGLWDVISNEDAVTIARMEEEAEAAAQKLTVFAYSGRSADNITCIVVKLHHHKDSTLALTSESR